MATIENKDGEDEGFCSQTVVSLRPGSALHSGGTLGELLTLGLPQSPDL